ncbi:MAG: hypothetical protein RBS85_08100 [Methanofastidiosum sp.]|jgi:hypothetical protein|nr:hypothetical protein [Methanofastidiosum sp.]
MTKIIPISVGLLVILSFIGTTSVLSDDCVSIILEKDNLKVGDSFFVYPLNATINHNLSTGIIELVAANGHYNIYVAKCSGTIVFENCESRVTVRIFPKETPFEVLMNMIGRGKK